MTKTRPKNLNLFTIRFPIPAIVSILHRLSGVFLFILIPFALWGLSFSLTEYGFETIQEYMRSTWFKCIFWLLFIPFTYHLVAGIRHLVSDVGVGTTLKGGRLSALLTFIISVIVVLLIGVWLW